MTATISRRSVLVALFAVAVVAASVANAAPIVYSNDTIAQSINVIRRYDNGTPLFSVNQVLLGGLGGAPFMNAFDGGPTAAQWNGLTSASHGVRLQITLDQEYDLRRFQANFNDTTWRPSSYEIAVSQTGFGSMATVVTGGVPNVTQVDTLAAFETAKYIQYSFFGPSTTEGCCSAVILQEFQAFANFDSGLTTQSGWNDTIPGTITGAYLTDGWGALPANNLVDKNFATYILGAAGTAPDGIVQYDLGSVKLIEALGLGFFAGQGWGNGVKIELSRDNVNFTTVHNQITTTGGNSPHINISDQTARYIRLTNYGKSGGALTELEIYTGALPVLSSNPGDGGTLNVGGVITGYTANFTDAITLQNTGELTSELQILSYSITGDAAFTLTDFAPTLLTAGGTDTVEFDLQLIAGPEGTLHNALLTFFTNVGDIEITLLAEARPVPEPATLLLVGAGMVGMVMQRRRRSAQA